MHREFEQVYLLEQVRQEFEQVLPEKFDRVHHESTAEKFDQVYFQEQGQVVQELAPLEALNNIGRTLSFFVAYRPVGPFFQPGH